MCDFCSNRYLNDYLFYEEVSAGIFGKTTVAGVIPKGSSRLRIEIGDTHKTLKKINFCPMCGEDLRKKK